MPAPPRFDRDNRCYGTANRDQTVVGGGGGWWRVVAVDGEAAVGRFVGRDPGA
jgi:hypothetical protein